ncbi:hypothetical protein BpHYR1_038926 [Brachionus plicatilis]|uniref:Uncharacterized protein n=1 Tax=Brachionus plicatilis TaxID=10195 RepID=A0A3M7S001_BRAPC|nr:hypothetical protein BpHYR1_038926 [Brachionus plicatilis]
MELGSVEAMISEGLEFHCKNFEIGVNLSAKVVKNYEKDVPKKARKMPQNDPKILFKNRFEPLRTIYWFKNTLFQAI